MMMIIGGAYQGKYAYAHTWVSDDTDWVDGDTCSYEEIFTCLAVNHFHMFVKRFMNRADFDAFTRELIERNPGILLVSDELGYGVVPMDAADRAWREKTGRVCTTLAAQADTVHRVVCGLGMVLKDA